MPEIITPAVAEPSTATPTTSSRNANAAIILLLAAVFVVFLNETVMGVALSPIMKDLGVTPSAGQWLTTAFALTMAIVVPITGWLLQVMNTRPVFITAMSLFSAGSLVAATAPVFGVLLGGRIVQAMGTAMMMPLLITTVLRLVPLERRGRVMGRIAMVMSVAPAIGPAVSGIVLDSFGSWRVLFWISGPLAIIMLLIGILRIPNVSEPQKKPLDVLSVILAALGFGGLVYGLGSLGAAAEGNAAVSPWVPLIGGLVFLGAFVARQLVLQRTDRALLDLRTFCARSFSLSIVLYFVTTLSLFGAIIVLPLYVQNVLLSEAWTIGVVLLPGGLIMGFTGPFVGRLYDRFGTGPLLVPGAVLVSAGLWGLTLFTDQTSVWLILLPHMTLSTGLGMMFTCLFTVSTSSLPPHLYSHGSATIGTLQQVAAAAGTAAFIAVLAAGTAAAGATDGSTAAPEQVMVGVHWAFQTGAILSLIGIGVAFFIHKPKAPELTDESLEPATVTSH